MNHGCATWQTHQRLPKKLVSRSAGRGQGRRKPASFSSTPLTTSRRGGYDALLKIGHRATLPTVRSSTKFYTKLVGVAPLNRDSGSLRGRRTTWGGRATVRTALYLPTLVATHKNPLIAAFYARLRQAGKPSKVALIAAMRKLLTILNAMLKHHIPWSQLCPA